MITKQGQEHNMQIPDGEQRTLDVYDPDSITEVEPGKGVSYDIKTISGPKKGEHLTATYHKEKPKDTKPGK